MQRTISAMVGKGSVNHNSRKFKAENVDGIRTHLNIDYCSNGIISITVFGRCDFWRMYEKTRGQAMKPIQRRLYPVFSRAGVETRPYGLCTAVEFYKPVGTAPAAVRFCTKSDRAWALREAPLRQSDTQGDGYNTG